jgi:hypothetical protein
MDKYRYLSSKFGENNETYSTPNENRYWIQELVVANAYGVCLMDKIILIVN